MTLPGLEEKHRPHVYEGLSLCILGQAPQKMAERCLHFLHCLQSPSQANAQSQVLRWIRNIRIGSKVNFTRNPGKTMTRKQRGEVEKSVAGSLGARGG